MSRRTQVCEDPGVDAVLLHGSAVAAAADLLSARHAVRRGAAKCVSIHGLGSAIPDGWLWAKIAAAALRANAFLTTSRG